MTASAESGARLVRIRGHVQGVGYRNALHARATELGLSGWVRNRSDGSVEALVAGAPAAVEAILEWARRGPPAARVSQVDWTPAEAPAHTGFRREATL